MRKSLLIGLLVGALASVLPAELVVLAAPFLFLGFLVRMFRLPPLDMRSHVVGALAAIAVVTVAVWLPLGRIDQKVGPMHYEAMPLELLTQVLQADWGISVFASSRAVAPFDLNEPMSRRKVIEKLAEETGSGLRFRTCASGATFLFGCSTAGFLYEKRPALDTEVSR